MKSIRLAMLAALAAPNQGWVKSLEAEAEKSAKAERRDEQTRRSEETRRYINGVDSST